MGTLRLFVFSHMLPTVAGSALSLLLVLMAIIFVKRSGVRHTFLLIPLVKPLLILLNGVDLTKTYYRGHLGIRPQIPDPLNLAPQSWTVKDSHNYYYYLNGTGLLDWLVTAVLIAAIMLIAIRWSAIVRYRANLAARGKADTARYGVILGLTQSLSKRASIKTPKVVLADTISPFMVGILNPVIVLPDNLIDGLSEHELEAILAHEIAHIKRRDNFWLGLSLICRDLMFFNPIAWFIFNMMMKEREKAADHLAARFTGKPVELASSLVKVAECMIAYKDVRPSWSVAKTDFTRELHLETRVKRLLKFKTYRMLILRNIPLGFLLVLMFWIRLHILLDKGFRLYFFG